MIEFLRLIEVLSYLDVLMQRNRCKQLHSLKQTIFLQLFEYGHYLVVNFEFAKWRIKLTFISSSKGSIFLGCMITDYLHKKVILPVAPDQWLNLVQEGRVYYQRSFFRQFYSLQRMHELQVSSYQIHFEMLNKSFHFLQSPQYSKNSLVY